MVWFYVSIPDFAHLPSWLLGECRAEVLTFVSLKEVLLAISPTPPETTQMEDVAVAKGSTHPMLPTMGTKNVASNLVCFQCHQDHLTLFSALFLHHLLLCHVPLDRSGAPIFIRRPLYEISLDCSEASEKRLTQT